MSSSQPTRPAVTRGTDPVVRILFWVLILVGVAAFLEFRGPYKGWLSSRLVPATGAGDEAAVAGLQQTEQGVGGESPQAVAEPLQTTAVEAPMEEPPKSEMELLYDKLYAQYLAKYSPPAPGSAIHLKLREGDEVVGTLEEVSPGRVSLRMKFGTMSYAMHRIHPSMYPYLFPERTAKMKALADLEAMLARQRAEEDAKLTAEADRKSAQEKAVADYERSQKLAADAEKRRREQALAEAQATVAVRMVEPKSEPFHYDPSPADTPENLKKTIQSFGMRLQYQQRAMGAPIANKIYAKQQGDQVVLYMEMSKTFQSQSYDVRFAIAEQLWNIWSMRCNEAGKVRAASCAHIVMLDEAGKQIAGSTLENGADIWVKQGKG